MKDLFVLKLRREKNIKFFHYSFDEIVVYILFLEVIVGDCSLGVFNLDLTNTLLLGLLHGEGAICFWLKN